MALVIEREAELEALKTYDRTVQKDSNWFRKEDDAPGYFRIKLPNLSESRPSLLPGDIMKFVVSKSDKKGYQRVVEQVQRDNITVRSSSLAYLYYNPKITSLEIRFVNSSKSTDCQIEARTNTNAQQWWKGVMGNSGDSLAIKSREELGVQIREIKIKGGERGFFISSVSGVWPDQFVVRDSWGQHKKPDHPQ